MTRSLFVIEGASGEFWLPQRERNEAMESSLGYSIEKHDPTASIVEYVPRVRCEDCEHQHEYDMDERRVYCRKDCRLRRKDWYCADHQPRVAVEEKVKP